jgi:hypothetical protein
MNVNDPVVNGANECTLLFEKSIAHHADEHMRFGERELAAALVRSGRRVNPHRLYIVKKCSRLMTSQHDYFSFLSKF